MSSNKKQVVTVKDSQGKSIFFDNDGVELAIAGSTATVTVPGDAGRIIIGSFPGYVSAIVTFNDGKEPAANAE